MLQYRIIYPQGEEESKLDGETFFPDYFFNLKVDILYLVPGQQMSSGLNVQSSASRDSIMTSWTTCGAWQCKLQNPFIPLAGTTMI
jgi:hypothetical protein